MLPCRTLSGSVNAFSIKCMQSPCQFRRRDFTNKINDRRNGPCTSERQLHALFALKTANLTDRLTHRHRGRSLSRDRAVWPQDFTAWDAEAWEAKRICRQNAA